MRTYALTHEGQLSQSLESTAALVNRPAMQFLFRVQAAAPITAKAVHAISNPRRRGGSDRGSAVLRRKRCRQQLKI